MGSSNHVLDGGPDRTNPFAAARGDKSAMRPIAILLWSLDTCYLLRQVRTVVLCGLFGMAGVNCLFVGELNKCPK